MHLAFKGKAGNTPLELSFNSINDFGGQVPYRATLKHGVEVFPEKARPR